MDVLWMFGFRRRGYQRMRREVEKALARNEPERALAALMNQERRWAPNWGNGSRRSVMLDFDHLRWLAHEMHRMRQGEEWRALAAAAEALRALHAKRSNFGIDGRMMKGHAAMESVRLDRELQVARDAARRASRDAKEMM